MSRLLTALLVAVSLTVAVNAMAPKQRPPTQAGRAELAGVGAAANSNQQSRHLRAHNMPAPAPGATAERAVRAGRTNSAAAREYAGLAARIDKNLTIGRVVNVELPLLEAPTVPSKLLEAFPNTDPELFETMPVGLPVVTFEIPNNEAVEAGLVDSRGNVASGGKADAYVFYQPNDSAYGNFLRDDDTLGFGTWSTQAILGNGFQAGMTISAYDFLMYNSAYSVNDGAWSAELWDGDPRALLDTVCNGGNPQPIAGTQASWGPLPQAPPGSSCEPVFGNADPDCVGLYRLRATLPDKVVINCDRVWVVVTMTQGCRAGWRRSGTDGDVDNAPAFIGQQNGLQFSYDSFDSYGAGTCCNSGATCDFTDPDPANWSGAPCSFEPQDPFTSLADATFCSDGVADLVYAWGNYPGAYAGYVASVYAPTDISIQWHPKRATAKPGGSDVPATVNGNEIILHSGECGVNGVNVELEIQVNDWSGPDGTTRLQAFAAKLDTHGYSNGLGDALTEKLVPCTDDVECVAALGGFCSIYGDPCTVSSTCQLFPTEVCYGSHCMRPPSRLTGFCAPAYSVTTRPDFALRDANPIGGTDLSTPDYHYGKSSLGEPQAFADLDVTFKDGKAYMGTLWVEVPPGAKGSYTVGLYPAPATVLVDQNGRFIPLVGQVSATITIPTGKCCAGTGAHDTKHVCIDTLTKSQCQTAGICKGTCRWEPSLQCAGDARCDKVNPGDTCQGGMTLGLGCLLDAADKGLACDEVAGEECVLQGRAVWSAGESCTGDFDADCPGPDCYAPPAPASDGIAKNRYLSVKAGDPGRLQAIRVRFVDLPSPFDEWEYGHPARLGPGDYFVGRPREVCEHAGKDLEVPADDCSIFAGPTRTFWAAPLLCDKGDAHFMDWHGECVGGTCVGGLKAGETCCVDDDCVDVVHIFHEGIVPSKMALPTGPITEPAVYEIQVVDVLCPLQDESSYSPPLTLTQSGWGDVCGPGPEGACSGPPDGVIDVQNDVLGLLDKFANVNNLQKARADIEPGDDGINNGPDFKVHVANDVLFALEAFDEPEYPFQPGNPCEPD